MSAYHVSLLPGPLCSVDLCVCLWTSTMLCLSLRLDSTVWDQVINLWLCSGCLGLLWLPVNFYMCFHANFKMFLKFCEECHWHFHGDCTESINFFGEDSYFHNVNFASPGQRFFFFFPQHLMSSSISFFHRFKVFPLLG